MNIVSDLDGTLIDVSARNHAVYETVVRGMGGEPLSRAAYWAMKRSRTSWEVILGASNVRDADPDTFLAAFIEQIEQPRNLALDTLHPAALALLDRLRSRHTLTLATLRRSAVALRDQLAHLGLRSRFDSIAAGPAARGAEAAAKAALIRDATVGEVAVLIGDTETDIGAAVTLRARSIAVCSGFRDRSILTGSSPTALVDDLGGVEDVLTQWGLV